MHWTMARRFSPRATSGSPFELFNRYFGGGNPAGVGIAYPAFNVWANNEGAVISGELPGVKLEDLEITASGKTIGIKGTRKDDVQENGAYLRRERHEGQFSRSIELPFQIDAGRVEAKLANGVLEIRLPRAESDKPRKISING